MALRFLGHTGQRGFTLRKVAFGFDGVVTDDPPFAGLVTIEAHFFTRKLSRTDW